MMTYLRLHLLRMRAQHLNWVLLAVNITMRLDQKFSLASDFLTYIVLLTEGLSFDPAFSFDLGSFFY